MEVYIAVYQVISLNQESILKEKDKEKDKGKDKEKEYGTFDFYSGKEDKDD